MNDNDTLEKIVSDFRTVCQTTEEVLEEWQGEGNIQFPKLFGLMAMKLNWGEPEVRKNDPLVRHYIQNHPRWIISLGPRGGVMKREKKEQILAEKMAQKTEKKPRKKRGPAPIIRPEVMDEVRAEVEARVSSLETRAILTDEDEEEFGELS